MGKLMTYNVAGHSISFDPETDTGAAFTNALAEAVRMGKAEGAAAGVKALKGALSLGVATSVFPSVDGSKVNGAPSIEMAIDGTAGI